MCFSLVPGIIMSYIYVTLSALAGSDGEEAGMMSRQAVLWDFEHDPSGPAALRRLLELARGDAADSRAIAGFLLSWWDWEAFGRWSPACLSTNDPAVADDMLSVITSQSLRVDGLEHKFEALIAQGAAA